MDSAESQFCALLRHEGIGTLYERIVKGRMLRQLAASHGYTSILEYGAPVTKGFDNLPFVEDGLPVTVADADVQRLGTLWPFARRPVFTPLDQAPKADLVWSFARAQLEPRVVDEMLQRSQRHVLVFVPNILNPGAPVHAAYHLVSRTHCRHAERGRPALRTRAGLVKLLRQHRIGVIDSGYIDAPPIPNIAFSLRELKETFGLQTDGHTEWPPPAEDPEPMWRRIEALTRFETLRLARPFRPILGHHVFALGAV